METVVEVIEESINKDVPLSHLKSKILFIKHVLIDKLIKFANVVLRTSPGMHKKFIKDTLKSDKIIPFKEEYRLMGTPKYITFTLNYGKYFNNLDTTQNQFMSRPQIPYIMPETFKLQEIFSNLDAQSNRNMSVTSFASYSVSQFTYK